MIPRPLDKKTTRGDRAMHSVDPKVITALRASRGAWFETEEEISAGLDWGRRKAGLLRWVRAQMGRRLTQAERRCVELHFFAALSFAETAKKTGMKPCTVSRTIARSLRKLRAAAQEDASWHKYGL